MSVYVELLLVAGVTVYIVDISGFTGSWRDGLARVLHVQRLRPLRPFDCGKCMTWWACLLYAAITGCLSLGTVAFAALLSHLSVPMGGLLIFIREWLTWITNRLSP